MPKRKCVFSEELQKRFLDFRPGRNSSEAECLICPPGTFVSIANKGGLDLEAHQNTGKHKTRVRTAASSSKVDDFFAKKDSKRSDLVRAAEGALSFHTVKHHQSFKSMDCTGKLQKVLFKDSNIAKEMSCARTKTEAIVNSVLSPHSVNVSIDVLKGISCFGVATDGSNHGSTKLFPILIQYYDVKSGGIQTKVIELKSMPNEKSETIASYICDTLRSRGIDSKCVAFSGDNTNTNFGGISGIGKRSGNNVFTHLKNNLNDSIVGVGCPAHVLHNCIQHGIDAGLTLDVDSTILKIFNYFSVYTVRTESLKDFCEFVDIQYRQLLGHSKTRWLSLFPCVTRVIEMYPALKSYFMSQEEIPILIKVFFQDELSEARLWFVHSLMSLFHHNILALEREKNSLVEMIHILESVLNVLQERQLQSFKSLKLKEILRKKRNEGYDSKCDMLEGEIAHVYDATIKYLKKWLVQYQEFFVFRWMGLKTVPNWEDVEHTILYLNGKLNIKIDDIQCFDQFCNFQKFLTNQANVNGEDQLSNDTWCKYFQETKNIACFSELLKMAEFFFAIPSHNASVERIFSLVNSQWTKDRNRLSVESVKGIISVQYNYKDVSCVQFYDYLLQNKKLLSEIGSSNKYMSTSGNNDTDEDN